MAVMAIHPVEHLAEELKALELKRGGTSTKDCRAHEPRDPDPQRHTPYHWRYRPAPRSFLRHRPAVLVEPANPLRRANNSRTENGKVDPQPPKTEVQTAPPCLNAFN